MKCTQCEGTGTIKDPFDGGGRSCHNCWGAGEFLEPEPIDLEACAKAAEEAHRASGWMTGPNWRAVAAAVLNAAGVKT